MPAKSKRIAPRQIISRIPIHLFYAKTLLNNRFLTTKNTFYSLKSKFVMFFEEEQVYSKNSDSVWRVQ